MKPRAGVAWGAALVVVVSGVVGCGSGMPPTYPAEGRVVLTDGQPVTSGLVEFESFDQPYNARGAIGADGVFRLQTRDREGAIAGKHRAIVTQALAGGIGSMATKNDPRAPRIDHAHGAHQAEPPRVAPRYADYRTSQLEFEVVPEGPNEYLIRVEPAGR